MSESHLEILSPGVFTTIQDLGRPGLLRQGVPASGALDPPTLRLLNAVLGNDPGAAGLECVFAGPELEVAADRITIAVAGLAAKIIRHDQSDFALPPFRGTVLNRGDRLKAGATTDAACGYVAVSGGIRTEPVLSSRSTYLRAGFGGLDGRALMPGDELPVAPDADLAERALPSPPVLHDIGPIRVVPGPQQDAFTDTAIAAFLGEPFTVGRASDRVGLRLEGPKLEHRASPEILSEGIAHGSIQVPGSGEAIILMGDRQTIGGYPKIATVIRADLPRVGRLRVDETIRFGAVSRAAAEQARREAEARLAAAIRRIGKTAPIGGLNLDALWQADLSGAGYRADNE